MRRGAASDPRNGHARGDAGVACVMRLRVGVERAAEAQSGGVEALARMRDERARRRKASCNLEEARVATVDAGGEGAAEPMGDVVEPLPG